MDERPPRLFTGEGSRKFAYSITFKPFKRILLMRQASQGTAYKISIAGTFGVM
jgi:hypothetical protein